MAAHKEITAALKRAIRDRVVFQSETPVDADDIVAALGGRGVGQSLVIEETEISGTLSLSARKIDHHLRFAACIFRETPAFDRAKLFHLDMTGSTMPGIQLDGAEVSDDLDLEGIRSDGVLRGIGLRVLGQLRLSEARLSRVGGTAAYLDHCEALGGAYLRGIDVAGELSLHSLRASVLFLTDATCSHPTGTAIYLDGSTLTGNLHLSGMTASGEVTIAGARIDGSVHAARSTLRNPFASAVVLDRTRIGGDLQLPGASVVGAIRAERLELAGSVLATSLTVESNGGPAISLDGASVHGSLDLRHSSVVGGLRASGTHIGADVRLAEAQISNHFDPAVLIDRCELGGAFIATKSRIVGSTYVIGTTVGGGFHATEARFEGGLDSAVVLDGTTVRNLVNFSDAHFLGELRACDADFNSQLFLSGAVMRPLQRFALCMQSSRVRHSVHISPAALTGELDLSGSHFSGAVSITLRARPRLARSTMRITETELETFELDPGRSTLRIYAQRSSIGLLRMRNVARLHLREAAGWEVKGLERPDRDSVTAIAAFLDRLTTRRTRFVQQPWFSVAAALDASGETEDARWLRRATVWRAIRGQGVSARTLNTINGLLLGHGYYPARIIYWMAGLSLVTITIAMLAHDGFVPTNAAYFTTPDVAEHYPAFNPLLYALDTTLPAALTGQSAAWRAENEWLGLVFAGLRGLGWVFAALFVAGVTGILKLRK